MTDIRTVIREYAKDFPEYISIEWDITDERQDAIEFKICGTSCNIACNTFTGNKPEFYNRLTDEIKSNYNAIRLALDIYSLVTD